GTIAALSGATVLGNLSASNVTVGKWEYRQDLVRSSSAKNLAVQLYSAAGFGESTADLAWDGQGLIAERGEIVAATERFSLGGNAVTVDIDLRALVEDRLRQSSWGQNAAEYGHALRTVDGPARPPAIPDHRCHLARLRHLAPHLRERLRARPRDRRDAPRGRHQTGRGPDVHLDRPRSERRGPHVRERAGVGAKIPALLSRVT